MLVDEPPPPPDVDAKPRLSGLTESMAKATGAAVPTVSVGTQPVGDPPPRVMPQFSPGTPGRRVPAHVQPQGWSTSYVEHPEGVEEGATAALDQRQMAAQLRAQDAMERRDAEEQQRKATSVALGYEQDKIEERRAERAAMRQRELDDIRRRVADAEKTEIDPDQFWKEKGSWGRLLGAIAMGAGAWASTVGGGPNTAKQIIDGEIARNIEAQKAAKQSKWDAVGKRTNIYQDQLAKWQDEESADLASLAAYKEQVATAAKQRAERVSDKQVAAGLLDLSADYEQQTAELKDRLYQRQVQRRDVYVPERVVGGSGPRLTNPLQMAAQWRSEGMQDDDILKRLQMAGVPRMHQAAVIMSLPQAAVVDPEMQKDLNERYVPGVGVAPTKQEAIGLRETVQTKVEMDDLLTRTQRLIDEAGIKGRYDKAQLRSLKAQLLLKANKQAKAGALDEGSLEVMTNMIGAIEDNDIGTSRLAFDEFKRSSDQQFDAAVRASGALPARRHVVGGRPVVSITSNREMTSGQQAAAAFEEAM